MATIQQTGIAVRRLKRLHDHAIEEANARRDKLARLDGLLDRVEALNLHEVGEVPKDLARELVCALAREQHPIVRRPPSQVTIEDWYKALFEVQDPLLLPADDKDD